MSSLKPFLYLTLPFTVLAKYLVETFSQLMALEKADKKPAEKEPVEKAHTEKKLKAEKITKEGSDKKKKKAKNSIKTCKIYISKVLK